MSVHRMTFEPAVGLATGHDAATRAEATRPTMRIAA
jgi:hypothetical protein